MKKLFLAGTVLILLSGLVIGCVQEKGIEKETPKVTEPSPIPKETLPKKTDTTESIDLRGKILFISSHDLREHKLWAIDPDTKEKILLHPTTILKAADGTTIPILNSTFSPDGKKIAAGRYSDEKKGLAVWITDLKGEKWDKISLPQMSFEDFPVFRSGIAWSPDRKKIAFYFLREADKNIYIINTDGTGLIQLTQGYSPSWSPDGKRIVFSSRKFSKLAIIDIDDIDGSTRKEFEIYGAGFPAWSPDGKKITYTGAHDLYILSLESYQIRRLTTGMNVYAHIWSPDGTRIAFDGYLTDPMGKTITSWNVYLINANGSNLTPLTGDEKQDSRNYLMAWIKGEMEEKPVFVKPTEEDIEWLARVIVGEASIGSYEEQIAVGWTVLNRREIKYRGAQTVRKVVTTGREYDSIWKHLKGVKLIPEPSDEIKRLARELLEGKHADPTGGATHFFSPRSMPKEGESTVGFDVGGGLQEVPGIFKKVYFPSWTKTYVWVGDLPNVRRAYFMFYRIQ